MHTTRKLIAIALIAWFVAPVCCCSSMTAGKDSSSSAASCCQSAEDTGGTSDGHSGSECPCGKRTLAEGKAEVILFASPGETNSLLTAVEWLPVAIPYPETLTIGLYQPQDLPPPHTSWFAYSGSWLL